MDTQEASGGLEETEGKALEDKPGLKDEVKEKKPEPLFEMVTNPARVLPQQV